MEVCRVNSTEIVRIARIVCFIVGTHGYLARAALRHVRSIDQSFPPPIPVRHDRMAVSTQVSTSSSSSSSYDQPRHDENQLDTCTQKPIYSNQIDVHRLSDCGSVELKDQVEHR
jgi:hypothetical protein